MQFLNAHPEPSEHVGEPGLWIGYCSMQTGQYFRSNRSFGADQMADSVEAAIWGGVLADLGYFAKVLWERWMRSGIVMRAANPV
jgi:hypothetical protein